MLITFDAFVGFCLVLLVSVSAPRGIPAGAFFYCLPLLEMRAALCRGELSIPSMGGLVRLV